MKRTLACLSMVTLLICFGSGAQAQMMDTGVFFGGGFSYAWENFDTDDLESAFGDVSIDDSWGLNLFVGYRFIKYLSFEGNFNWYDSFQIDTNFGEFDLEIWTLMLDAKVMLPLFENKLVPYLRLGGGYMYTELEDEDEDDFAWNFGGGFDFFITKNVSLGLDLKYVLGTGDLDEIEYYVGSMIIGFHF